MGGMYQVARLHPETVSNYQKHISKRRSLTRKNTVTVRIKVDAAVWKIAMDLADGDSTRIIVRSENEVIVTNHSRRKN